jgi:citryl-CoA synthetase large subunit
MNLYEWEGKNIFKKYGITTPKGVLVRREDNFAQKYQELGIDAVVVKAQVQSGKRGKNNGIRFCNDEEEVVKAITDLFTITIRGQYVAAVLVEEKLTIAAEHYLSITYDTTTKQPILVYSEVGGMDIEDVAMDRIVKQSLDVRQKDIVSEIPFAGELWHCLLGEDARLVEINPLVVTSDGKFIAADAKIALDEDAFYRHSEWQFEPRTMLGRLPTDRELQVKKIDEGENYYRGTAGKYIEMDGDIAILFSGGGASIANMDALIKAGCQPANYTEYSGNPPREKVYQLAKIVLSKPGLKGLWIAGGVANFTNIAETFHGIVDALDEVKPTYPIVIRRAGPFETEGMQLMKDCAERNSLNMHFFGKEKSMSETAGVLARLVHGK